MIEKKVGEIMIQLTNLTKKYGDKIVVNNISLNINSGIVTGFLGPNGAGKTTTMRIILGLAKPTSGSISIAGKTYVSLEKPLEKVGAMIDSNTIDTRLTPWQYLSIISTATGININRVDEILTLVGLQEVTNKKVSEFSFGMKQRLGIAVALLGNPDTVILDEPFNGLDVDGIHWLRTLIKDLAKQGKSVLVSSHLLGEVQEVANRIIVLARGELITDMGIEEMKKESIQAYSQVRSSNTSKLKGILEIEGAKVEMFESSALHVREMEAMQIGEIAFENGIRIYELMKFQPSLEQLFSELVDGKTDYKGNDLTSGKRRLKK
jgi:ABC-2 type transport system ATP-binding protein